MAKPERGLGKGLNALFGEMQSVQSREEDRHTLPLGKIISNKAQPRKLFDESALKELADSIRQEGVLQPLLVRPLNNGNYEIVAGERRWRAAKLAGLETLPVIIRHLNDEQTLALALIENLQREDLNPMEEALGYKELRDKFNLSQNEIAERVGKSRSAVANILRLLQLPALLQDDIISNKITQGHARPLIGIEDEEALMVLREAILEKDPNVREVERWVADWRERGLLPDTPSPSPDTHREHRQCSENDPSFPALEAQLSRHFGLKASLRGNLERGTLKLSFASREELAALLKAIGLNLYAED
ncbi:MAG: ParB/RepB/Spo0J family partition protein [Desulfovibrionaceae bacterium]|nr:ParB/RepB/Spo0J family partition protein [Desulfovibrionaceae bacterium]